LNEVYYSESSTRSNAPFAADGAAAIGVEGVTTAGAARSGKLSFVIILATFNLARTRRLIVAASLRSSIVRRRTTSSNSVPT